MPPIIRSGGIKSPADPQHSLEIVSTSNWLWNMHVFNNGYKVFIRHKSSSSKCWPYLEPGAKWRTSSPGLVNIPHQTSLIELTVTVEGIEHLSNLIYSWNSLTRSRWDQRKYFELSEVRVKHRLFMTFSSALQSDCQHSGYLVHTLYNTVTDTRFSALWRMFNHELHNKYETLKIFIYCNNYGWNTTKLFIVIQFQHITFMFTESDRNRTRKSEFNKQFTDWIKGY